jgi:hypothetical protein
MFSSFVQALSPIEKGWKIRHRDEFQNTLCFAQGADRGRVGVKEKRKRNEANENFQNVI